MMLLNSVDIEKDRRIFILVAWRADGCFLPASAVEPERYVLGILACENRRTDVLSFFLEFSVF